MLSPPLVSSPCSSPAAGSNLAGLASSPSSSSSSEEAPQPVFPPGEPLPGHVPTPAAPSLGFRPHPPACPLLLAHRWVAPGCRCCSRPLSVPPTFHFPSLPASHLAVLPELLGNPAGFSFSPWKGWVKAREGAGQGHPHRGAHAGSRSETPHLPRSQTCPPPRPQEPQPCLP